MKNNLIKTREEYEKERMNASAIKVMINLISNEYAKIITYTEKMSNKAQSF